MAANINCPGSWHDSRVATPIYEKLRTRTPDGYYLVADTAFPRGTNQIDGKIRAPMKQGQKLPADKAERDRRLAFDAALVSYRQSAEWGMRALQGSFGRLRIPLEVENDHRRANLLEIYQLRTVYEPLWTEGDQADVWNGFGNMLFGEQRRKDRVSGFYNIAVEDRE